MNNPHQALIEEKVAEIVDTEYIGGKQPNLNKEFVTQTLQATIDTVLEEERERASEYMTPEDGAAYLEALTITN